MTSKQSVIKVEHVSKDFILPHESANSVKSAFVKLFKNKPRSVEVQHALKDINIDIKEGEFVGIVGRNGSGKSTLLKILAGIYQPTEGKVTVTGRVVPFIELGVGFNGELTGRENVYLNGALLGYSEQQIEKKYDDIVAFAELERFMDQKLKNYSSGMQVRLAFSVATKLAESEVLLIDEVLAVGDADFQAKCFEYFRGIKKQGKTVVFVSHDMGAVREYCDRAILIENSRLIAEGPSGDVATEYSKLFLKEEEQSKGGNDKRWGDKVVEYVDVSTEHILGDPDRIQINVVANAKKSIDEIVIGFTIKDSFGTSLFGTNNKIKKKTISVKAGQKINGSWSFDNIFVDGAYSVDVSIEYDHASRVADWWQGANIFTVKKTEHVPYPFNPPIDLDIH